MRIGPYIAALALAACANGAQLAANLDQWRGRHVDDLIRSVGPPASEAALSDGGRVIEYRFARSAQVGGTPYPATVTAYSYQTGQYGTATYQARTPTQQIALNCQIRFVVSPAGVIDSWSANGNDCH